jgi:hypothetical protein
VNKLVIFTGEAVVDFRPTDDDTMTKGVLNVVFSYDLGDPGNLIDAAASASLANVFNLDTSKAFTYATDCADVRFILIAQIINGQIVMNAQPMLTASIAVRGAGGHTGLKTVSYQANVWVKGQLQLLVSPYTVTAPPDFQTSATIVAGSFWIFKLILPVPANNPFATVDLASDNPQIANVVSTAVVLGGQTTGNPSSPQPTKFFTTGPAVDVHITAVFGVSKASATLHIVPSGK